MSDMSDELTRSALQDLRYEIEKLQAAVYGDRKEPPNGGGLYGQVRRLRAEMVQSVAQRDTRMQAMEEQMDTLVGRVRPQWQESIIIAGGIFMAVVALLQVILFVVIYQIIR
jgi:hypothetical protein